MLPWFAKRRVKGIGAGYKAASRRTTHNGNAPRISSRHWRGQSSHTYYQKKLAAISIQLYPSPGVSDVVVHNESCYVFERCHIWMRGKQRQRLPTLKLEAPFNGERPRYRTVYARWILRVLPVHIWRNIPEKRINFLRKISIKPQNSKFHQSPWSLTGCSLPS